MRTELKYIFDYNDGEIGEDRRKHILLANIENLESALEHIIELNSSLVNDGFSDVKKVAELKEKLHREIHDILDDYNIYEILRY